VKPNVESVGQVLSNVSRSNFWRASHSEGGRNGSKSSRDDRIHEKCGKWLWFVSSKTLVNARSRMNVLPSRDDSRVSQKFAHLIPHESYKFDTYQNLHLERYFGVILSRVSKIDRFLSVSCWKTTLYIGNWLSFRSPCAPPIAKEANDRPIATPTYILTLFNYGTDTYAYVPMYRNT